MSVLFELWPQLREHVAHVALGAWPTAVSSGGSIVAEVGGQGELWLKRDDRSSALCGGNKLRLLEYLLGEARARGADTVYSTGARGSNFALATTLCAPSVGLTPGAICFPEAMTEEGERSHAVVAARARVLEIAHWSLLPLAAERVRRSSARAHVLSQVRLAPESLFGYLAAGLELAQQVAAGALPAPAQIILPIGSAATSAGVLGGLSLARKLGIWQAPLPRVSAVRIAPWPLSRHQRVRSLALETLARLEELTRGGVAEVAAHELAPLEIVTSQLGAGYPHATPQGIAARHAFNRAGFELLDDTYSGKAAAHLIEELRRPGARGPFLFWCTKSSVPLPEG
jgi:1-aminocyclopropane-1-carboxylate deaminase/D-cysteine desulfhydrase-like pyridoxal-dependent ACC family enzyme